MTRINPNFEKKRGCWILLCIQTN